MTRSGRRPYTTGTRRQVTAEWIERVKAALEARKRGPRWLEQEAGLAKGAATKILDGSQQTSNHVDAIGMDEKRAAVAGFCRRLVPPERKPGGSSGGSDLVPTERAG